MAEGQCRGVLVMDILFIAILGGRNFYLSRHKQESKRLIDRLTEQNKYVDEAKVEAWQRRTAAAAYFALAASLCILAIVADALKPAAEHLAAGN
jgi:hypothetical protein